ncbi:MAG: hypothetical protein JWR10_3811 [Rubritepida sp.]|nr:hypothetical protein [Rubritepida sp.]
MNTKQIHGASVAALITAMNAGSQQVLAAYQQMALQQMPAPSMGGMKQSPGGSRQVYSTGQIRLDHQQRMQQQQK